ncbi:hypothetical protein QVD17_36912 [Tagetes erecta]|uniref:Uncharacterized protein n=1 Tax=Tagetes erecta TaxID=13708 RepID=A0AAD8JVJ6_TARER|nr:hypothetical protein QVD17_36912 [Tagetes erecta]
MLRPIAHAIWDPHFGQPAVEAFTRGGAPGPVNIAYSGVYQWWYTIGLRTNEDLYTGALFLLFISAISLIAVAVISVFSIIGFLCGSHGGLKRSDTFKREKNTVHLGDTKPKMSKLGSGLSSKALLMAKMISWRKVDDGGYHDNDNDNDNDDDEAVWKRTIIMGERCRPLEFSGKISYDENGNSIPESPHKRVANDDQVRL